MDLPSIRNCMCICAVWKQQRGKTVRGNKKMWKEVLKKSSNLLMLKDYVKLIEGKQTQTILFFFLILNKKQKDFHIHCLDENHLLIVMSGMYFDNTK